METEFVQTQDRETKIIFDVFVADPLVIDQYVYRCWLQGLEELETATRKQHFIPIQMQVQFKNLPQLLLSEIHDQFRNFRLLEHHLRYPHQSGSDAIAQITPQAHQMMIESYYELDNDLLRELIGRKLTNGLRRDLQDTSEEINLKLACCWRMFDNLKRVYKTVTSDFRTHAVELIQRNFGISRDLSSKYARIVFMCFHRFDATKRRLQFLTYSDFDHCTAKLMANWVDPQAANCIEIDLKLKDDIRDLKAYLGSAKDTRDQYKKLVKAKYASMFPSMSKVKLKQIQSKFKVILKSILTIGANLSDTKQFKDLFTDIVEKIGEPCSKAEMAPIELDTYFKCLADVFEVNILGILRLRHGQRFAGNWRRYLEGLRGVIGHIYPQM